MEKIIELKSMEELVLLINNLEGEFIIKLELSSKEEGEGHGEGK